VTLIGRFSIDMITCLPVRAAPPCDELSPSRDDS
jgi:hypothetical protein